MSKRARRRTHVLPTGKKESLRRCDYCGKTLHDLKWHIVMVHPTTAEGKMLIALQKIGSLT